VRGAGGSNCQVPVAGAVLADADGTGVGLAGGAAVWLAAAPWGAPVLGVMVPHATTVSTAVAPRTREASAGAKPAEAERIVLHFFVRPPKTTPCNPAEHRQPPLMPLTGPLSLWLWSCP
jgi:hypothetical protein